MQALMSFLLVIMNIFHYTVVAHDEVHWKETEFGINFCNQFTLAIYKPEYRGRCVVFDDDCNVLFSAEIENGGEVRNFLENMEDAVKPVTVNNIPYLDPPSFAFAATTKIKARSQNPVDNISKSSAHTHNNRSHNAHDDDDGQDEQDEDDEDDEKKFTISTATGVCRPKGNELSLFEVYFLFDIL